MKSVHGWAFPDADDFMAAEMKPDGRYQDGHLTRALAYIRDYTLAVDGGAHVGTWSRLLAEAFDRVIAVEPSADTYKALLANLAAFRLTNVEARQVALWATSGRVSMALDARATLLKNTGGRYVEAGGGDVSLERLDDWNLPALGFLKLDVEGSEFAALQGARQTIKAYKPIILFENKGLWKKYGVEKDGPQRLLRTYGYREIEAVGCDRIWGPA